MLSDVAFVGCNALAAAGWLCLLLLPRWRVTGWLVRTHLLPALIAGVYTAVVLVGIARGGHSEGGFLSLEDIGLLFDNREVVLAGWVHYLAFDLLIGSWELAQSQRLGIGHAWMVPCLLATLWVGPIGLLAWLGVKKLAPRRVPRGI